LRILHIVPSLAPQTGGPSQSVPALCRAVARQGHDVTLYTSTWPHTDKTLPPKGVIQTGDGFAIRTFPSKRGSFGSSLPHSPDLLQALDRHADRFDIIVTHSLWNPVATFSRKLLRNKGRRYCIMPHGMLDPVVFKRNGWKKFLWAILLAWVCRGARAACRDALTGVSDRASMGCIPPRGSLSSSETSLRFSESPCGHVSTS